MITSPPLPPNPPSQLQQVMDLSAQPGQAAAPFKGLRGQAQEQAAYALGAQAGESWRYDRIDHELNQHNSMLDALYNFIPLLLNNERVAPPVVVQGDKNLKLESPDSAEGALVTWEIIAPARIITTPPNWRAYLIERFTYTNSVNPGLLPKDSAERALWKAAVWHGWQDGVAEALHIYDLNLARLTRDFTGMARFHLLAEEGMVSMPHLANGNLGVVIERNRLVVGAHIYRISAPAQWQEPGQWKPQPGLPLNP